MIFELLNAVAYCHSKGYPEIYKTTLETSEDVQTTLKTSEDVQTTLETSVVFKVLSIVISNWIIYFLSIIL